MNNHSIIINQNFIKPKIKLTKSGDGNVNVIYIF